MQGPIATDKKLKPSAIEKMVDFTNAQSMPEDSLQRAVDMLSNPEIDARAKACSSFLGILNEKMNEMRIRLAICNPEISEVRGLAEWKQALR